MGVAQPNRARAASKSEGERTQDLKKLIAEREAHLAAWARFTDPEVLEVDIEAEVAKLDGELREAYCQLSMNKRKQVRKAIRQRRWPADFTLGWFQRGRVESDAL